MQASRSWVPLTVALLAAPGALRAGDKPLSQVLPDLLTSAIVTPSSTAVAGIPGNPHEAHFLPALAQQSAAYDLNRSLVTYLSTFPLGSSSGGFTYQTDSRTGIPKRSSGNFGPSYTERALTIGKGKFSAGVNFQSVRYESFEGLDLASGADLVFYLQHNDCCPRQTSTGVPGGGGTVSPVDYPDKDPAFEGDLLRMGLSLTLKNDTTAFFANYGLTDRLDLGIAVPLVRVQLDALIDARIERLSTTDPRIHTFAPNQDLAQRTFADSGTATGLGDVALRAKYNFLSAPGGGLALGLDLRLPTGNKDELLGTGATQVKPTLVYSGEYGRFAPRATFGYTFSSGTLASAVGFQAPTDSVEQAVFQGRPQPAPTQLEVPDEINYAAGASIAASPKLTLNFDVIGRTIRDQNRFDRVTQSFPFRTSNAAAGGQVRFADRSDVAGITGKGDVTALIGAFGLKWNLSRTLLLTANVLFPLNDSGLRVKVAPAIGLDYAF